MAILQTTIFQGLGVTISARLFTTRLFHCIRTLSRGRHKKVVIGFVRNINSAMNIKVHTLSINSIAVVFHLSHHLLLNCKTEQCAHL
jgi:hypothetical protein